MDDQPACKLHAEPELGVTSALPVILLVETVYTFKKAGVAHSIAGVPLVGNPEVGVVGWHRCTDHRLRCSGREVGPVSQILEMGSKEPFIDQSVVVEERDGRRPVARATPAFRARH